MPLAKTGSVSVSLKKGSLKAKLAPSSVDQVTSVWLKERLDVLGVKPIPALKADRWKLYLRTVKTAPVRRAASKGALTEGYLMAKKVSELRTIAHSIAEGKGDAIGAIGTRKLEYTNYILANKSDQTLKKSKPATKRRVNPRKIIKGPASPPPKFLTKGCRSLVGGKALMKHQERVIEHFTKHSGLIVFHKPGSGKTLTSVSAALCWLRENPKGLVFVAVPGHLSENFIEHGLKKFYGLSHNYIAKHFVVDTYVKLPKYVAKNKLDQKPFFLIVDEAHKLKAVIRMTKRGRNAGKQKGAAPKGILDLAIKAKKVLVMTGTVFRNTESDLENLVAIARAPVDKGVIRNLLKTTATKDKETKAKIFDPEKVKAYFKCIISYYPGDPENIEDYPVVKYHSVKVKMPIPYWKKYWREHQELKGLFLGLSDRSREMYITNMRMAANKFLTESPRAEEIARIIKSNPKLKTIIYSGFRGAGVETIRDVLAREGIKSTWLNQELSKARKAEIVDNYNSSKENTPEEGQGIVLITKATSEGTDFQGTRRIIIMEKDFSTAAIQQIVARGSRFKSHSHLPLSERKVDVYFLELAMPDGVPKPGKDERTGIEFKLIDERVNELIGIKDRKEKALMDLIIDPKRKVTIETDPDC